MEWETEISNWVEFDQNSFLIPSRGKCVFITTLDAQLVGLGSWDPRQWPEIGIIGHNCILPAFRGNGFGIMQIQEILRIFSMNRVTKASVSTNEHPFFIPAQQMYIKAGFIEKNREPGGPDPKYRLINYEKFLKYIPPK